MPTKLLDSQAGRSEVQKTYKFGGGKNEIRATDDETSSYGYIIDGGGGDDMIFGSDFEGLTGTGTIVDPRTLNGDLLIGGMGSDTIVGGAGDDWIYGGNEDGSDGGKGKDPVVSNTLVGDTSFGSVGIDDTVIFGSDHIFGGDGVSNVIYGDNEGFLSLGAGSTTTGGDDYLRGGDGSSGVFLRNDLIGDTQGISAEAESSASFTGGNDKLVGGSGVLDELGGRTDLVKNFMTGDVGSIGNVDTFQGGNDILISGEFANDIMRGDWASIPLGYSGTAVGGEDTFVFGVNNGADLITDFRRTDDDGVGETPELIGDKINLTATGLSWDDLAGHINVNGIGGYTIIDLGQAIDDTAMAGVDQILVSGVTDLVEADFVFDMLIDPGDALV